MAHLVTIDGNTTFLPIVAGVQQGDTLVLYLFIITLDYVMRIAVAKDDNFGITLHLERGRCCLAVCLMYADRWHVYVDAAFCSKCTLESTCNKWTIIWKSASFKCHDQALLYEIHGSLLSNQGGTNIQSYPKLLENDMGTKVGEIESIMDRDLWQQYVCERLKQRLDKWWWYTWK